MKIDIVTKNRLEKVVQISFDEHIKKNLDREVDPYGMCRSINQHAKENPQESPASSIPKALIRINQ
jgi:hypothetical protein